MRDDMESTQCLQKPRETTDVFFFVLLKLFFIALWVFPKITRHVEDSPLEEIVHLIGGLRAELFVGHSLVDEATKGRSLFDCISTWCHFSQVQTYVTQIAMNLLTNLG